MVTKAKKALLASLAAFLCVMLTVFGLSMSVSLSETAKAADETTTEVAEVSGVKYETLQAAIDAAPRNAIVTLLADTRENVTITQMYITLDLNGHTINGGTVNGKPAVTVTARVTIKDSSADQTGTIMREDTAENSGVSSYYVIDVQGAGWLTFESGNVKNNSGVVGVRGASLVRVGDDSVAKFPGLNIKGGTFTQNNFIVIKVDRGDLFLNGGTLNSANSYAIEDWHRATVKGGTVNGDVAAWTYSGGSNSTLEISGGTINGNVTSVNYGNTTDKKATVSVTGGTINGMLDTRSYDPATGDLTSINDAAKATIGVSGGTFSIDPSKYVVEESAITENADGTFGVKVGTYVAKIGEAGYETLAEAIAAAKDGETVKLLADIDGNLVIEAGKDFTLDLNGYTINGGTGTAEAAITNYGTLTITDSSAAKLGTITRGDNGVEGETSYYVILNLGTMTIEQANVVNNSGYRKTNPSGSMVGSSLICNGNDDAYNASLTIENGHFEQQNFIAIKNGGYATLTVNGGEIVSKHSAIQNWCDANINGGKITGQIWTDAYVEHCIGKTIIDGTVEFTGEIVMDITGSIKPELTINGGNLSVTNWRITTACAESGGKPAVSGGTFSSEVNKDYLANGFVVNKNTDGTYGVTAGSGFAGANVVVTESLAMKVVVGTASKYVVVTYKGLDGIPKTVRLDKFTDIKIEGEDYKYCLFDQIMPQMIDVKFSFELYGENGVMLDRKANYSVVDYLADIIASEKDSAAFRNVAASLIEYANRAKAVKGLTTTVAPTFVDNAGNPVTLDYDAFVKAHKIPAKDTVGAISQGDGQVIYKAKVVFDDAYTLKFYTNAGDGYNYTLSKNGSTENNITFDENGEFTINVLAQDITTQYVIKVYGEDKTQPIQTVTYGVSTYCIRMQEAETPQGELYVASYYYGVAVNQYGTANPNSVQG